LAATGQSSATAAVVKKRLKLFSEILHHGRISGSPKPIAHFEKTRRHWSLNVFKVANSDMPQLPYSSNISPCDFFLFSHLKTKLKGDEFETLETMCSFRVRCRTSSSPEMQRLLT
jgi:hypothetical protein